MVKIYYDDSELVNSVLNGDIESFRIIVNKYEFLIFKYIHNMIKDEYAAKDLTQEVFITVYNKLYTYKGDYKFCNWIYKIARNKSLDYLRKNKKVIELNIESVLDIHSRDPMPEQWVELTETRRQLERFIKSLDGTDKQIILLKRQNDKIKFSDISEILKLNVSTVKTRYYRLWDKYKKYLDEGSC